MVGRQLARATKYIVKSSINIVGKKITQIIYSYFFLRVCECTVGVDVGDHPIDVDRYSVAMGGCTCIVLRGVVFPFFPFY
jgi:hypothetical protein